MYTFSRIYRLMYAAGSEDDLLLIALEEYTNQEYNSSHKPLEKFTNVVYIWNQLCKRFCTPIKTKFNTK